MEGLVAAGALAPEGLQQRGVARIPLLSVSGETILARVCRCLIEGGGCERVHVLAPEAVPLPELPQVSRAPYSGAIIDDLLACLEARVESEQVLLASGDMPLLTVEAVAALGGFARTADADVVYPVVAQMVMEQRFPGGKRTYARLGGTRYTGGNVFALRRSWILGQGALLKRLFARRKDPVGLARLFGLLFVLRLLLGLLTLEHVERHLSRVLKGKLRAAVLPYAELAADLDKVADLETFAPYLDPRP